MFNYERFFSSPEQRFKWALLITRCPLSVRLSVFSSVNFSYLNFSKTTWQILTKFGTKHVYKKLNINSKKGQFIWKSGKQPHETLKKGGWVHFQNLFSREPLSQILPFFGTNHFHGKENRNCKSQSKIFCQILR